MTAGDVRDDLLDLVGIQSAQSMVRTWVSTSDEELRTRGDAEERAPARTLAAIRVQEVERRRIGPVHILDEGATASARRPTRPRAQDLERSRAASDGESSWMGPLGRPGDGEERRHQR